MRVSFDCICAEYAKQCGQILSSIGNARTDIIVFARHCSSFILIHRDSWNMLIEAFLIVLATVTVNVSIEEVGSLFLRASVK